MGTLVSDEEAHSKLELSEAGAVITGDNVAVPVKVALLAVILTV